MKAILTAAAAAFAVAGAFAQVQTGEPSNGSKLGVTPPPSTSVTTDTSRLSTDCSTVAEKQRSHQAGGTQVGSADCASKTTTMGASGTTAMPATAATTTQSSTTAATTDSSSTNTTAMSNDTTSKTDMAMDDTASKKVKKARKARADRG